MRIRFRFAEPDRERFGDEWFTLDRDEILRQPLKRLREWERQTRQEYADTVAHLLGLWYLDAIEAKAALTWIACDMAGRDVGRLADWDPLVMLIDWELPGTTKCPTCGSRVHESRVDDADPPDSDSSSVTEESNSSSST